MRNQAGVLLLLLYTPRYFGYWWPACRLVVKTPDDLSMEAAGVFALSIDSLVRQIHTKKVYF